jgi:hypothetical protein
MPGISNGVAGRVGHFDLDFARIQMPVMETTAEAFARGLARALAGQRVQQPLHRRLFGRILHRNAAAFLFQPHRFFHQVAGNLFDVAADIADFRELGRFHLHERRIRQLGQPTADLRLAAAVGPIIRMFLGVTSSRSSSGRRCRRQRLRSATATGPLGVVLADDVGVERGHHCLGRERIGQRIRRCGRDALELVSHLLFSIFSIVRLSLV